MRLDGESVLRVTGNAPLRGEILGGDAHMPNAERVGQRAFRDEFQLYVTRISDSLRLYRYGLVQMVKRGLVYLTK